MSDSARTQVQLLADLLSLTRDVATARSEDLAAYAIVNQSFQLVPYHIALLWRPAPVGAGTLTHASGLAKVEADRMPRPPGNRLDAGIAARVDGDAAIVVVDQFKHRAFTSWLAERSRTSHPISGTPPPRNSQRCSDRNRMSAMKRRS